MRIDRIKLIVLMAERDMTIGRLAELSRLSVSTICQVKAGKSCTKRKGYITVAGRVPRSYFEQKCLLERK